MEIGKPDLNGMNDPLVVRTADLKKSIEIWAVEQNFERKNPQTNREGRHTLTSYLSQETELTVRRIYGIIHLETEVTTFTVADKIITAIERPDLMPESIPNPRWNQERWHKYMEERGCV